jgi:hypothetical protein
VRKLPRPVADFVRLNLPRLNKERRTGGTKSSTERPPVAILIVNGFDHRGRWGPYDADEARRFPWIKLCLERLRQHTTSWPYRVFVWDNSFLDEHARILEADSRVSVFGRRDTKTAIWHPAALDRLCRRVPRDTEYIVTMDSDAFPVRDGWLENLLGRLNQGATLTGIWRDEMAPHIEPFVHPSCLAMRRSTRRTLGVRFSSTRGQDAGQAVTKAVLAAGGRISRLRRSNALNPHFLMAGIYGDLIYHHGAGSRRARFWTSRSDTDDDEALRVQLREAAFDDLDHLIGVLTGDLPADELFSIKLSSTGSLSEAAPTRPPTGSSRS